jgi:hypothetical protein
VLPSTTSRGYRTSNLLALIAADQVNLVSFAGLAEETPGRMLNTRKRGAQQ